MWQTFIFPIIWLINIHLSGATISDKEYASMPELFHLENFDTCMLLEDDALYCTFAYKLQPLDEKNPNKLWSIIERVSSAEKNYRHDLLRHGICVPKTCNILSISYENQTNLRKEIQDCYDEIYHSMGLKGIVSQLSCETSKSKYEIDTIDILAAAGFGIYILFIAFASFYEGIARYQGQEYYNQVTSTKYGKIITAFSIPNNWIRLTTVNATPDVEKLRCIQGIRLYNMMIVIMAHTVLIILSIPVINTKYVETMNDKFMNLFLSSGGLCVSTFFFISSFLTAYNFLVSYENKNSIDSKVLVMTFINRYIRLIPSVAIVVLFHCTWLVHLSRGPLWDSIVGNEYRKCRKNWWTNLLFLQNDIDVENMCVQITWYLGVDNQMFGFSLVAIWLMKKYESKIGVVLSGIVAIFMSLTFFINYYKNFTAIIIPTPEDMYALGRINNKQFHIQITSVLFNSPGSIVGLAYGYIYYKYNNTKLFTNTISVVLWWFIILGFPLGIIIFPGYYLFSDEVKTNIFWASVFIAVSRYVFSIGIGFLIFGVSQGIGWMVKWVCEWKPTYVLGRISFGSYLVQMIILLIGPGYTRSPIFLSDYYMITETLINICLSLIFGAILTVLFEMPISQLQKMLIQKSIPKKKTK